MIAHIIHIYIADKQGDGDGDGDGGGNYFLWGCPGHIASPSSWWEPFFYGDVLMACEMRIGVGTGMGMEQFARALCESNS